MPEQTQGAVLRELQQPLRLEKLTLPDLKPGQVLVDVAYSGICHTQLLEIQGKRGHDRFIPHTLGHEGSGIVAAIGEGVTRVKSGDHVVLTWIKADGADGGPVAYGSTDGTVNSGPLSTFLRRTVASENRLVPIPADMPLREAALLGCAVPTGAGTVVNTMQPTKGSTFAIFGVGGVGASAMLAVAGTGPRILIAIDILDSKLQLAREFGATHVINGANDDPLTKILELTDGRGVDYAIEAVGRPETMEAAFASVRDGGGLCVLAGNVPYGETISIDPFHLIRGKRLVGTAGGDSSPDLDIPRYVQMYRDGQLHFERLARKDYAFDDLNQAIDDLAEGRVLRPLIAMDAG